MLKVIPLVIPFLLTGCLTAEVEEKSSDSKSGGESSSLLEKIDGNYYVRVTSSSTNCASLSSGGEFTVYKGSKDYGYLLASHTAASCGGIVGDSETYMDPGTFYSQYSFVFGSISEEDDTILVSYSMGGSSFVSISAESGDYIVEQTYKGSSPNSVAVYVPLDIAQGDSGGDEIATAAAIALQLKTDLNIP